MRSLLCKLGAALTTVAALSATPIMLPKQVDDLIAHKQVEPPDDAASLSGIWVPIHAEHEGQRIDPADDNWHCVITGTKITHFRNDRVHVSGNIEIQPTGEAGRRMYWKYSTHPVTDSVIYTRVGEDVLFTCWTGEWAKVPAWPQVFATDVPTGGKYLVVWRRVHKQVQQQ